MLFIRWENTECRESFLERMAQKTANMFGEEYVEDSNFSPGKVNRESTLIEKVKWLFPEYDVMLLQYKVLFYPGPWEPSGFMATQLFMETEPNCGYQWRMWHWTCNILWLEYNTIVSIFGPPNHQASFRSRVQAPTHLQLAAIVYNSLLPSMYIYTYLPMLGVDSFPMWGITWQLTIFCIRHQSN